MDLFMWETVPLTTKPFVPQRSHNLSIIIHDSDTKFPQYLLSVSVVTPVSVQVSHHQNHIMTTAACNRV